MTDNEKQKTMKDEKEYIKSVAKADIIDRGIHSVFSHELLSNRATHFDNSKGVMVKVFSTTIFGNMCSANIMEGPNLGNGTTCFLTNLSRIKQ